ncbi:hypothetical protein N7481_008647 [Penicillium waksmanii]|uniref:uncharacterized protein n=1 Tax=Penicillium waksmanii TaxID=69791 RepID=UPI0025477FAF|nr:uncharacterized protein N7481_008647 [Penicillium waksmanii]KAJ5974940.1 hypothetical protein N7481_008647 [Penicillium waksmanii]
MAREAIVTLIIGKTGNLKNKRQTSEPAMGNYLPDLDENSAPVEQTEEQLTWIRIHRQEIRSGHRIIEREMHIGAQLLHYDHAEEQGLDTSSSKIHQLQIEVCNRQLKAPRGDFIAHSQRIVKLERAKPPGRRVREYLWQTQQHQRRTLWKWWYRVLGPV